MDVLHLFQRKLLGIAWIAACFLPWASGQEKTPAKAQPPLKIPASKGTEPWTLTSAFEAFQRHPDDPYLQYITLQLYRQTAPASRRKVEEALRPWVQKQRRQRVDLFSLFGGGHAVQESLQLESLLPESDLAIPEKDDDSSEFPGVIPPVPQSAPVKPAASNVKPVASFVAVQDEPPQEKKKHDGPSASLTFLPEGLRAVVNLERRKSAK